MMDTPNPEAPRDEPITVDLATGYVIKLRTEQGDAGEPTTKLVAEKDPALFTKLAAEAINSASDNESDTDTNSAS